MTKNSSVACKKCGRPLRDGVSIVLGIGPVCRGKIRGRKRFFLSGGVAVKRGRKKRR